MKKTLLITILLCMIFNFTQAQFQQIQTKTNTSTRQKSVPTVVNDTKIFATVIQPATGNFTNPSNVSTLPDGKRVTMTLIQNPQNLSNNFGGIVKENVQNTSKNNEEGFTCTTETKTINAQSSTFMNVNYNQQAIHLYPGAIYTFANFFSGNYRALEQGRNPITVATDNLANSSGAVFEVVQNPTGDNIRSKIANIIRTFSTTNGSAGIQYRVFTSNNDADMSIKLSAGGGYAGFKASGGFSSEQTEKKYYLTIDAIKPMYTLTSSIPANGYFADKSVESNNANLIVLKSVTYGTRVLANLEITIATQKDAVDFKASFGADSGKGVSANAFATFNYLKNSTASSSSANVYVVGGPINTTLFEKDKLQEQITELISRCNYQTAQPLAYSFTDINGNVLGIQTATDQFKVRNCVPVGSVYKLVSATVQIYTGKENKEQGSNASFYLSNSDGIIVFENTVNNIEFKSQNDIVLNSKNAMPDQYLLQSAFTKNGGYVDIFFDPKQIFLDFDTWNVNSATLTLTFQDQSGATDVRNINFNNAAALLQKNQQRLRLPFSNGFIGGGAFMPGL